MSKLNATPEYALNLGQSSKVEKMRANAQQLIDIKDDGGEDDELFVPHIFCHFMLDADVHSQHER